MLRFLLFLVIVLHGLIHLMGFAKAFHFGNMTQLTREISRTAGIAWLMAALLFVVAGVLFLMKKDWWWAAGVAGVVFSQYLIFTVWQEAKFGTVANVIILIAAGLSFGSWRFEQTFRKDVSEANNRKNGTVKRIITEKDIEHLPPPVQNYLRYVGVLDKPAVSEYTLIFEGQMREKGKDWFPFVSEQHNYTREPTRLFFMKAKMFGVTVPGYHAYKNGAATMQIKLFGLFPVVDAKEGILDKAETVTIFNDMCLLAPATLISPAIQWQPVDDTTAKAAFTVKDITITATLYFNREGQLVNFVSDDRYAISDKKQYRFSTPVKDYRNYQGYRLPGYGEAVWHYPDGEFAYGRFHVKKVRYNER
jgi:hypothetical protein